MKDVLFCKAKTLYTLTDWMNVGCSYRQEALFGASETQSVKQSCLIVVAIPGTNPADGGDLHTITSFKCKQLFIIS